MEPPVSVPSEATQRPAATAAAEPPDEPPGTRSRRGVVDGAVGGVLVGGAHGELVAVELAEQDGAGGFELGDGGGVVGRHGSP
jgi:hypothetical protein